MKTFKDYVTEEKSCPAATKDYLLHFQNKEEAIYNPKKAYGPYDPTVPNVKFWKEKAEAWEVAPGEARKRICSACEYFDESPETSECLETGPVFPILNRTYSECHAGRKAYCTKHKFIADELRSCNGWEENKK